jgi:hypothetical protein
MRIQLCSALVVALTLSCLPLRAAPQSDTSQKDRAKKCEETAKNRGLKGDEKVTYVSTCMAAKDTASSAGVSMSPQERQKADKAKSCEQQADQQSLKGKDRRSFFENLHGQMINFWVSKQGQALRGRSPSKTFLRAS